jgi:hypothetical protein
MICLAGCNANDRDQRHSQVADLFEQAVQRRLIGYRASQQRLAIVGQFHRQAGKPVDPLVAEMASQPDLIELRGLQIGCCIMVCGHMLTLLAVATAVIARSMPKA